MQVTSITVAMGFTINVGDYQSVKCELAMRADLDRNEDEDQAVNQLRSKVLANLVAAGADAHPDRIRALVGGKSTAPAATMLPGAAPVEPVKGKPGRKPKNPEAAPAVNGAATLGEALGDSIPDTGGGLLGEEDDGDLLGGGEPEITREILLEKLREINKSKGNLGLLPLFKKVGATSLKDTPESKFQELYALANAALAS